MEKQQAFMILTLIGGGLITWALIVLAILKADAKIFARRRPKTLPLLALNQALALGLAIGQFFLLNWTADLGTGYGFGYAIGAAALFYLFGSPFVAALTTFIFLKGRR